MPKKLSNPPITFVECPACLAKKQLRWSTCKTCLGFLWGYFKRGRFFYWGRRISGPIIILEKMRRVWNIIIEIILLIFVFLSWAFVAQFILTDKQAAVLDLNYWNANPLIAFWFWFGLLVLAYVISRWWRSREVHVFIQPKKIGEDEAKEGPPFLDWSEIKKLPRANLVNISLSFSHETIEALELAYTLAEKSKSAEVLPKHLFASLIQFDEIEGIFIRLGIMRNMLDHALGFSEENINEFTKHLGSTKNTITFSTNAKQIICHAYEEAVLQRQEEVGLAELLIASVREDVALQNMLYDVGVEAEKLNNVVSWVRVRNILKNIWKRKHRAASHAPRGQTNKAMTALATPFLNQFSIDLTRELLRGALPPIIGREKELEEIFRIIEGGGKSVLLVGEHGVGKSSIIYSLAQLMLEENVPEVMRDSRLVQISVPALLSGATAADASERLLRIFQEVANSGNIVLCIEGIEDMVGVTSGGKESLDVSEVLAQELQKGYFYTIATTEPEYFRKNISHTAIANVTQVVNVPEMSVDETIKVLEAKVGGVEYKNGVWFAYEALEAAARLSGRFMFDQFLPAPAIEVVQEAAHLARKTRGKNALVTAQDVAAIVAQKTNIPVTAVTEDESKKLLRLEDEMHKRMIGQDEAVNYVASALRRARAELRSDKRPIANFLFLGPTGVGKTELAKTIAEIYFGREENMIRVDMSEYQDITSIQRLIGRPGEQGTGVLTEAVRQKPFALLLLDELEKANSDILNLFLQVMDDGRLTDSVGRTVDFTNLILIATSNAGTKFLQDELAKGVSLDSIRERLMREELARYFRPEFLNRFDGIVVFKPLTQDQIKQIARLMLKQITGKLDERGITIEFTEGVVAELAQLGFDPQFGARPLRRVIEQRVENKLASMLLQGQLKRGAHVVYDAGDKVAINT